MPYIKELDLNSMSFNQIAEIFDFVQVAYVGQKGLYYNSSLEVLL